MSGSKPLNFFLSLSKAGLLSFWMVMSCLANTNAQPSEEELLQSLEIAPKKYHDSIYYELFRIHYNNSGDLVHAKNYALKTFNLSNENMNGRMNTKACRALGLLYHRLGQYDSSKLYYSKGIEIGRKSKQNELVVFIYNDFGRLYESNAIYDSAMVYYNLSLELAAQMNMEEDRAFALNNIGLVYYYLEQFDEALENFEMSLIFKKKAGSDLNLTKINIALVYKELGEHDKSIEILKQVEDDCRFDCNDSILTDLYFAFGYIYYSKGDKVFAHEYLVQALDLATKIGDKNTMAYALYYLSKLEADDSQNEDVLEKLLTIEKIAIELKLRRLQRDIFETLIAIYKDQNNLTKVIEYQNKFIQVKDSMFNEGVAFSIRDIQLKSLRQQSDKIVQEKETQLSYSKLIIFLVSVIAILFISVSILLFGRYRFIARMKKILEKQVQLRTFDLKQNNEELRQLNMEFEMLLNQTSKYVRAPLATLTGLIDLVAKDQGDPQRTQDYIIKIKKVASSMGLSLDQLKGVGKMREENKKGSLGKPTSSTLEELLEAGRNPV